MTWTTAAFLALKISYINEIAQLAERVGAEVTQIARGIGLDDRSGPRFLQESEMALLNGSALFAPRKPA